MNTAIQTDTSRSGLDKRRLTIAGAVFVLFNILLIHAYRDGREVETLHVLARDNFPSELAPEKSKPLDARERKLAIKLASEYPSKANILYLLYRDATARRDVKASKRFAAAMQKLGWRNTAVQRSLLINAANEENFDALMDRADALLRRDVLTDEVLPIVLLFERNPAVRKPLVRALARMPVWRRQFFGRIDILRDPVQRQARFRTVEYLIDSGATMNREEIAPLVNALDQAGDNARAEKLWTKQMPRAGKAMLFDPAFEFATRMDSERPDLVMPFEWHLEQGTGYNSYVESGGGVRVEWDGHGVPTFLRQRLRFNGQRPIKISLALNGDVMTAVGGLDVSLFCSKTGKTLSLDRPEISTERDAVIYSSAAVAIGCDRPELRISGALRDTATPVDFAIQSVSVIVA